MPEHAYHFCDILALNNKKVKISPSSASAVLSKNLPLFFLQQNVLYETNTLARLNYHSSDYLYTFEGRFRSQRAQGSEAI